MNGLWIALAALAVVGLAALVYWQLVIAEGTYLGPRAVALMYDWVARRYDGIKRFMPSAESWFIAGPLLRDLADVRQPLVLDVATGTGRVPWILLQNRFGGRIVGLDLSLEMLRQAYAKLRPYRDQVSLVWQDASYLPFDDGTFDAVACMESLEFFPRPLDVLAEIVRVLAPGGRLFLTNRVGHEARLLPGRAIPRPLFEQALLELRLRDVDVHVWQENYDLALARKEGIQNTMGRGGEDLASLLRCPGCGGPLDGNPATLSCRECERSYPIREGIVMLAGSGKRIR
jgi:ubiquinone/menaquinone biosynthesis C-methylase UbiE